MSMKMHRHLLPLLACALVVPLSACGSDDDAITIDGAWARPSATGQTTGAVYFRITSEIDDRILAASVPASVAATAEVHEVVMADMSGEMSGDMDDMSGEMSGDMDDMSGEMQMTMQEMTDGLALPAGETVVLEPGGYHIMLLDLAEPLEVGDEVELTLDLGTADDITLTVEVAESAP
ncbi:MAG: copper chaperone PCu(A)C [Ilumatobacteraceae bacterium]